MDMSNQKYVKKISSTREALIKLRAKLSVASYTGESVQITSLESAMLIVLLDEKIPWS